MMEHLAPNRARKRAGDLVPSPVAGAVEARRDLNELNQHHSGEPLARTLKDVDQTVGPSACLRPVELATLNPRLAHGVKARDKVDQRLELPPCRRPNKHGSLSDGRRRVRPASQCLAGSKEASRFERSHRPTRTAQTRGPMHRKKDLIGETLL